ncbi:MAG: branched-chain amino acid ABC transporter permease [Gammaproteobacteria bacterium]|nr:branched-chain amino acid ABC transporter permease [Gammaproteobacteria bacterium]
MEEFLQHVINGVSLGSIYALIALGYTMVYGILQLINFAHSDVYMVGAFVGFYAARFLNIADSPSYTSFFTILLIAMAGCALLGFSIERFAYRPLRNAPRLNVLITAIGVSLFLEYTGQVVFGATPQLFPNILEDSIIFSFGGARVTKMDATILVTAVGLMIVLRHIIQNTLLGKAMRATSFNRHWASLMGISVDRIISMTFIIGSALAGAGAVLVGMKYPKIEPLMGVMIGLKAFVAAVLGGIGNIPGAVLGGLVIGIAEEFVVGYISSTYRDALAFSILIVILLFRPAGLLGRFSVEKV